MVLRTGTALHFVEREIRKTLPPQELETMDTDRGLGKETVYWLAEALSGGWVNLSLLEKIAKASIGHFSPVKYLKLSPEELKVRYHEEHLVSLRIGHECFVLPQAIVFDNTESRLPPDSFELVLDPAFPAYTIPKQIASKATALLNRQKKLQPRLLYDSTTIRLNRVELSGEKVRLYVSKAHYFDYLATNLSMDAKLSGWNQSFRESVHPEPRLCKLEKSLLANHLGVNSLVFTIDGFLILPIRSRRGVNIRGGQISPAISGACNFDRDIFDGLSRLIYPCLREGAEELGIDTSHFKTSEMIVVGITRELLRGGKPELFFATRLDIAADELSRKFRDAQDRHENYRIEMMDFKSAFAETPNQRSKPEDYCFVLEDFLRCLQLHGRRLSLPALTNLLLWLKYRLAHIQEMVF
jgi:hypothetical protein